jgi:hypothetical protein
LNNGDGKLYYGPPTLSAQWMSLWLLYSNPCSFGQCRKLNDLTEGAAVFQRASCSGLTATSRPRSVSMLCLNSTVTAPRSITWFVPRALKIPACRSYAEGRDEREQDNLTYWSAAQGNSFGGVDGLATSHGVGGRWASASFGLRRTTRPLPPCRRPLRCAPR